VPFFIAHFFIPRQFFFLSFVRRKCGTAILAVIIVQLEKLWHHRILKSRLLRIRQFSRTSSRSKCLIGRPSRPSRSDSSHTRIFVSPRLSSTTTIIHTYWCWLNGNFVLRLCDPFGPGTYLTFLGVEQSAATADALIDYAAQMNYSTILWRVPEVTAQAIKSESSRLKIEEDRDAFDYVYLTNPLARLESHAFKTQREIIARFRRRHPKHHLVHLDLGNSKELAAVRSAIAQWHPLKHGTDTVDSYYSAFEMCLGHASAFHLDAIGLFINNVMVGFNVAERMRGHWLMDHFHAFDPTYRTASTFLLHQMIHHASERCLPNINLQEDMGHPGIRRYKTDWSPCGFLRKFSISQAKDGGPC
jgi:hypothetical protein